MNLANRYQRVFPNILTSVYDKHNFYFETTHTERALSSFKAFADGLFGDGAYNYVRSNTTMNDMFLSPYSLCQEWIDNHDFSKLKEFDESIIFKYALSAISKRLGLKNVLNFEQFADIYDMCRFDFSWASDKKSPWCAVSDFITLNIFLY